MSVFNEEQDLKETIQSVLNQTYNNFEFIIINDKSIDNTPKILALAANGDERIKLIKNTTNLGLTKSLNKGINTSKYNYIARIDAGDTWLPKKLEKQVDFLNKNPGFIIIGTNTTGYNSQTGRKTKIKNPELDDEIRKQLLHSTPFVHPSIMFLKKAVIQYNESFKTGQDYKLYADILQIGKGYNLQEYLTKIRTHQTNSISLIKWKQQKITRIKMRFSLFKKYKTPFWYYFRLLPDIIVIIIPSKAKLWKNKILSFIRTN